MSGLGRFSMILNVWLLYGTDDSVGLFDNNT